MRRTILGAIVFAVVLPAGLAAQAPQQRLDAARARALQAGLPVELIDSKVVEGRAKGVPLERIVAAVEQRLEAGLRAQAASSRADFTPAEFGIAADALLGGVSEAVLGALVERSPHERRAVAIATLTQLVQLGTSQEEALQRVSDALARGPEALMNLPAQAAEAAARRGPPDGARPGMRRGQGGPPGGAVPAPGQSAGRGRRPGGG